MPEQRPNPERPKRVPRARMEILFALATGLLLLATAAAYSFYYPTRLPPAQPVSFSHHVHVTVKQLSCVFCHPGAIDTARSGVPPLETCLLCHSRIIPDHPEIRKLRAAYESGQPVEWVRVNALPRFVYFVHEAHLRGGFDCGRCHGDVAAMDRVDLVHNFTMGFCVQCHRDENFSHDCTICHR